MPTMEEEAQELLIAENLGSVLGRQRLAESMVRPLQRMIDRWNGFREKGTYNWATETLSDSLILKTWTRVLDKASEYERNTEAFLQVETLLDEIRRPGVEGLVKLEVMFREMSTEVLDHIRPVVMVRFRNVLDKVRGERNPPPVENPSLWDRLENE
jgi:hypothetical protein